MTNESTTLKSYTVNYEKLKRASTQELASFLGTLVVRDDYEYFDDVKHLLDIPEEPKGLEYYKQELEEKFDEILAKTKIKFDASKQSAEYRYNRKFDSINNNLRYAREYGYFPPTITICAGAGDGIINTTYNIGSRKNAVGRWKLAQTMNVYMKKKPNVLMRLFVENVFGFKWVDS